jgi:hypothetical protein
MALSGGAKESKATARGKQAWREVQGTTNKADPRKNRGGSHVSCPFSNLPEAVGWVKENPRCAAGERDSGGPARRGEKMIKSVLIDLLRLRMLR